MKRLLELWPAGAILVGAAIVVLGGIVAMRLITDARYRLSLQSKAVQFELTPPAAPDAVPLAIVAPAVSPSAQEGKVSTAGRSRSTTRR